VGVGARHPGDAGLSGSRDPRHHGDRLPADPIRALLPLGEFILLTAAGSGILNAALDLTGWLLGSQWSRATEYTEIFELIVITALLVALATFVSRRRRQRRSG